MDSKHYYLKMIAGPNCMIVTEKNRHWDILSLIKRSRADLDPEPIIDLLDTDAVYESQSTLEPLKGKGNIADYLYKRFRIFETVRDEHDIGTFILATVDLPRSANHPCLIFEADGKRQALWAVQITPEGQISRIDILTVVPQPCEAIPLNDLKN